uniref:Uncharacterized protein n=1 Tax=Anopheles atroparvus TaxID=41427 RepID=A0AAG5DQX8_ANOAO
MNLNEKENWLPTFLPFGLVAV